ncbi:ATP-binding cassette domain-containing protein [Blattabacterium cuenoti]|uniref:ATP-binding cassette domain-containing protein n=1 Tax=Blattabacterium cuenoti TaxID=1653831 RepID=UPI00293BFD36|nr:ATP-binding cassette domain-containing protein [Blattabacterium cuenoti]
MIKAKNIYKSFDNKKYILKGVTISIKKGHLACILGESGSGKSTLLHILGTLDQPTKKKM